MGETDFPQPRGGDSAAAGRVAPGTLAVWGTPPSGALARSVRGALALVVCAWLVDVGLLVTAGAAGGAGDWRGRLLSLGLAAGWALAVGVVIGVLGTVGSDAGAEDARPWLVRAFAWCSVRDEGVQRTRVAIVLAVCVLGLLASAAGYTATHAIVLAVARPQFAALSILGVYIALAFVCALAWGGVRRVVDRAASCLTRVPVVGAVVGSVAGLAGAVVVLVVLATGALALRYRPSLAYLPWREVGVLTIGGALALGWTVLAHVLPARAVAVLRVLVACLVLAGAVSAGTTGARDRDARRTALESLLGRAAYAVTEAAFDVDRDGALGLFGGGDCAPFDRRRGPMAIDVPNNGVDEDCDGADLGAGGAASPRTRSDWPVPDAVPKRPPIVLVTIDTLAGRELGALGGTRGLTPRLDALAARSASFTHCFSQGPSTRLSFPSIFSSRFDSELRQELVGGHPYPIHPSEELLAETVQRAGYDTVAVLPDPYFGKQRWPSLTQGFRTVIDRPFVQGRRAAHNGALVTDAAIEVLGKRREDPLFLWAHYYDAHSPHSAPDGIVPAGGGREAAYEAEVRYVDREVGRLVEAIEARLLDALVIVTADHGIAFDAPRHERLNYGYDLHTSILHVPLIVHAPFVSARRIEDLVSTMDVTPTIANVLRVKGRKGMRGASLVPELLEGKSSRPPVLMHQFFLQERLWKDADPLETVALRTPRYNLIHDRRVGIWQLYDWTRDYEERDDLSGRSDHAATYAALKQQLALWTYETHRGWERRTAHAEAR